MSWLVRSGSGLWRCGRNALRMGRGSDAATTWPSPATAPRRVRGGDPLVPGSPVELLANSGGDRLAASTLCSASAAVEFDPHRRHQLGADAVAGCRPRHRRAAAGGDCGGDGDPRLEPQRVLHRGHWPAQRPGGDAGRVSARRARGGSVTSSPCALDGAHVLEADLGLAKRAGIGPGPCRRPFRARRHDLGDGCRPRERGPGGGGANRARPPRLPRRDCPTCAASTISCRSSASLLGKRI